MISGLISATSFDNFCNPLFLHFELQSEVNFLGRLCHPNLVKLLGYCWEDQELLLVYEFMQRGSLENHLFGRKSRPWGLKSTEYEKNLLCHCYIALIAGILGCAGVSSIEPLSWDIRLKIAIDAAKGLAFLHSPDVKVIYRDFKASNILLDGVSYLHDHSFLGVKVVFGFLLNCCCLQNTPHLEIKTCLVVYVSSIRWFFRFYFSVKW